MRVFRVKLERSAADLGMPGASGLPPPSSWPDDYYWVQACSDTSWRVVRALSREQQYLRRVVVGKVGKGKRFVALVLVIIIVVVVAVLRLACPVRIVHTTTPLPSLLSRPVIHYHTLLLPTLSRLVPRALCLSPPALRPPLVRPSSRLVSSRSAPAQPPREPAPTANCEPRPREDTGTVAQPCTQGTAQA